MNLATIFGTLAGVLTSISFYPQALKIIKSKDTRSISLIMYLMFTLGVFIWVIYGFMINSMPVIVTNIVTFIPAFIILCLKIKGISGDLKNQKVGRNETT